MDASKELTPQELKAELDAGKDLFLLDVREDNELEISKVPGVHHIPMVEVADRIEEVPKDQDVVVICRSGGRSSSVQEFLLGQGYTRVRNLLRGTNGWAREVDTSLTVY